jgi:prepilin-type N-terminal cleavage/methylation domain-containing protein/prepilin-type processing-associated H-X9-DG protein
MRESEPRFRLNRAGQRGFSLPELLIVIGILALLMAILLPPIQYVHHEATAARCAHQLRQIGYALENTKNEYGGYYPLWDDAASPTRFTWIDILVQRQQLSDRRVAYCPDDPRPCDTNAARGYDKQLIYPGSSGRFGVDYSYGIAVPLSAGGWNWHQDSTGTDDVLPRRFENHDRAPGQRVLAADSNWSTLYNLSGDAIYGYDWSYPTQYDNMVEWRHPRHSANILYQDNHVTRVVYDSLTSDPVNTATTYLWHPGESIHVNPGDMYSGNWYPCTPPVDDLKTGRSSLATFPRELVPGYYTYNRLWHFAK